MLVCIQLEQVPMSLTDEGEVLSSLNLYHDQHIIQSSALPSIPYQSSLLRGSQQPGRHGQKGQIFKSVGEHTTTIKLC